MGFMKAYLQLNSMAAVTAILGDQEEDSRHGQMLESIYELRSRNWEVTISHTFREGNRVADLLAHHGHTLDLVIMLIVPIHMKWIELFGVIM
ncbi:hypothetical protein LINPERHAP2_LOCUS19983 [Linum perenne]